MTDAAFLLEVLSDGEPHSQAALLRRSFQELGHGCTVHSRIADLRKQGHVITCDHVPGKKRGEAWVYTLLGSLRAADSESPGGDLAGSAARSDAPAGRSDTPPGGGVASTPCDPALSLFEMKEKPAWA